MESQTMTFKAAPDVTHAANAIINLVEEEESNGE